MTKFKICGLREVGHAVAAAEAGADFLGFVFVPGVRRQLQVEEARATIQEYRRLLGIGGPRLVGLFANQPLEEVNRVARHCTLDMAQICGDAAPEYLEGVQVPVIRQVKVRTIGCRDDTIAEVLRRVDEVVSAGHVPLLDSHQEGALGGTGLTFEWSIAEEVSRQYDTLLAGGLSPENVTQAIAAARPWGVDVSSGVETDGVKEPDKILAFAERVREAGAA